MATITEDYCSFKVAKLLKEKGFNEDIHNVYEPTFNKFFNYPLKPNSYANVIACPTHQMAMKWLRNKYYIHIECIFIRLPFGYRYNITFLNNTIFHDRTDNISYTTPKEAVEAALKYCLENLI